MPNWGEVLNKIELAMSVPPAHPLDNIRREYLATMHKYTGRNVISYYSGFLQKPGNELAGIDDGDKNAFMQVVHKLDRNKGLDLILHTPGGNVAATESIVDYLKQMFGSDIRAVVPQIAMSGGTMIALSCKEIVMGKQSNIGPIDPQFGGMSCAGIVEEFNRAVREASDPQTQASIPFWQVIISKYHPSFLGDCERAIAWAEEMVTTWLKENMLLAEIDNVGQLVEALSSHKATKNHARHISKSRG